MSQPLASGSAAAVDRPRPVASILRDYVAITKPKHQFVLLTCWASIALTGADPSPGRLLFILFATALGVASSHVFNQLIDSDIDAKMPRTRTRPLAAQRISRTGAALYGWILGLSSIALMYAFVNTLSALLVIAGLIIYVPVYTMWLKRTSPWCTLIGGAAGAMPTLIGWAAVTGRIDVIPLLLFAFMVIWQCPHFFALTLFRGEDYRLAGVPMLAVVSGIPATLRQMLVYTLLMILTTVLLYVVGAAGIVYLTLAVLTGAAYLAGVILAIVQGDPKVATWGKRLFFSSYLYLALIFVSVAVDRT